MKTSSAGISLIKHFEGLRLTSYGDIGGVSTIGYGHTGAHIHPGMTITEAQADALLWEDVAIAEAVVSRSVSVPLAQCQFDGLVAFVFNIGGGHFNYSGVLSSLNSGKALQIKGYWLAWDHAGGVEVAGLKRRREAEYEMFSGVSV